MVGALSKALATNDVEVQLVTPLYRGILDQFPDLKPMDWVLDLTMGDRVVSGNVFTLNPIPNNPSPLLIPSPKHIPIN